MVVVFSGSRMPKVKKKSVEQKRQQTQTVIGAWDKKMLLDRLSRGVIQLLIKQLLYEIVMSLRPSVCLSVRYLENGLDFLL
jgi:hypothetical protein